jgi:nucleotide-binding universal stress UspA family protein
MTSTNDIVVGVDGSEASVAAIKWGAAYAAASHRRLGLVYVCDSSIAGRGISSRFVRAELRRMFRPIVDEARKVAVSYDPTLAPEAKVLLGAPSRVLIDLSHHVGMLVVGWTGSGSLARWMLGSVPQRLLANAECPVVVIPASEDSSTSPTLAHVVVGLRDTGVDRAATEFAFTTATTLELGVDLVFVDQGEVPSGLPAEVEEAAAGGRDRYPGVSIKTHVLRGDLGPTLAAHCSADSLLVLGRHVHEPHTPHLVGSHTRQILNEVNCAVVIVSPLGAWSRA